MEPDLLQFVVKIGVVTSQFKVYEAVCTFGFMERTPGICSTEEIVESREACPSDADGSRDLR